MNPQDGGADRYDAIIIGAGPSGSCAGAILAEYGHRVLILEREKFPRYHIGESLIPFTFQPLQRLGMIPKVNILGASPGDVDEWRHSPMHQRYSCRGSPFLAARR